MMIKQAHRPLKVKPALPARMVWQWIVIGGTALFLFSCTTTSKREQRALADRQWETMRGQVKLQLARQQCDGGQFEACASTAGEAVTLDPQVAEGYALLAGAELELGKPASAQTVIQSAADRNIKSPELAYLQGVILEQRGELQEAIQYYAQASSFVPGDVSYLVAHAECLVALGRADDALALINQRKDAVDDVQTLSSLAARVTWLMGDLEAAAKYYSEALTYDKSHPVLAEEYGLLLTQTGRFRQAISILEPHIERIEKAESVEKQNQGQASPSSRASLKIELARCYLATGDPQRAREILETVLQDQPDNVGANLVFAQAQLSAGDLQRAQQTLEHVKNRAPQTADLLLLKATLAWRLRDFDRARSILDELIKADPNDSDARCLIAEVLLAQGRTLAAAQCFQEVLNEHPDHPWATAGLQYLNASTTPVNAPTAPTDIPAIPATPANLPPSPHKKAKEM